MGRKRCAPKRKNALPSVSHIFFLGHRASDGFSGSYICLLFSTHYAQAT
jgi:hypothetical protein